ncbi:MAG: hypothetical protein JJU01_09775 [Alkalibacterium sp.]|nr:hypothetical protein [Alkalibacterium sp.]TVP93527.1 MAG: hypothetical protein EA249_00145 [Alkalibacterium sp.]
MTKYRGYALLMLFSAGISLSITFMLKAAVGVGAYDAFMQSLSLLSGIQIGTISMFLNFLFILGQLIILKGKFEYHRLLQIPLSIFIGIMVNFFYYNLFATVQLNNYVVSMTAYILALVLAAFSVSMVMVLNLVTFPMESLCMALTKVVPLSFAVIRQVADILYVVVAVALTFAFDLPPSVREGTVIGMLIFGPLIGFFIEKVHPILTEKGIAQEVRA